LWIITDKKDISLNKDVAGPHNKVPEEFIRNFKKKYKTITLKKGRFFAKIKRKFTNPELFVKDLIKKDPYIKEKVESIKWMH